MATTRIQLELLAFLMLEYLQAQTHKHAIFQKHTQAPKYKQTLNNHFYGREGLVERLGVKEREMGQYRWRGCVEHKTLTFIDGPPVLFG